MKWLIYVTEETFMAGRRTRRDPHVTLAPKTVKTNSAVSFRQDFFFLKRHAYLRTNTHNTKYFPTVLLQQIPAIKSTTSSTVVLSRPFLDAEIFWCTVGVPLNARAQIKSPQLPNVSNLKAFTVKMHDHSSPYMWETTWYNCDSIYHMTDTEFLLSGLLVAVPCLVKKQPLCVSRLLMDNQSWN